jgi:hypothetical protein
MFSWIAKLKNWDQATIIYALFCVIFVIPIILTGIYCYARLDFVRSYDQSTIELTKP